MTPTDTERRKHLVLIGLPGSGKSTVGALVADLCGVPFFDIDREIEREAGSSVAKIFEGSGEDRFRELESASVRVFLGRPDASVIAPGGGWAAYEGNLQVLQDRRVCVYLVTSAHTAMARASHAGGRPLLPQGRELSAMEELLMNRERYYAHADLRIETDGKTPAAVARQVAQLARMNGAL